MPRTLDKRRPFGTVHPSFNGAVFEQDGAWFNGEGAFLWEDRPAPEPEKVVSEIVTVDAEGNETVEQVETDAPVAIDPRLALTAWLKDELPDPQPKFMTVRGWAQDIFGEVYKNKEALITACVNKGLVTPDQVKA
jgi:hypothetical protein